MRITVHIPMQAFLVKYLNVTLGKDYTFSRKNSLSTMLFHTMEGRVVKLNKVISDMYFTVHISESYLRNNKMATITEEGCKEFALWAKRMFYDNMVMYIHSRDTIRQAISFPGSSKELSIKNAITQFRNLYNITEEELHYETCKKHYDRWKNSRKTSKSYASKQI